MSLPVQWSVSVGGLDVTRRMNRFLESIEVSGKSGGIGDSATLKFDDNGGVLAMPPKGTRIDITIDGRPRFRGYTDTPEAVISRGGGQTLELTCSGFKKTGKVKQALRFHKDECTLEDFLTEAAQKAGLAGIKVDGDLGAVKRRYWNARGRNFLQLGQSLADELGATFKIRLDQAVFAARGSGLIPGGGSTPTIYATRPGNIVECRISPFVGRPRYAKAKIRVYDRKKAKWVEMAVEIGDVPGGDDVANLLGDDRADEDQAERAGKGAKTASDRDGGSGSCTILLDVEAEAEGTAVVSGVRDGIDGAYRITSWTDRITRDEQGETALELKQPQGEGKGGSGSSGGSTE